MTEPAVETIGLTKDYGAGHGVFGLDLEIRAGEIFGFLGPNGSGKTTSMRMLVGLSRPTAGRARVLGLDIVTGSLELRRRVGFLAGDFGMYRKLTGAAMLEYIARLHGGVDRTQITALAERFDAQLDRPLGDLSTGNRQKIGLIAAFMHEPELLILDEPIAGLDPLVQKRFHELLAEVRADGRTVFLSSHTLSEVDRVADRIAILRAGRLVALDTLAHLRSIAVRRLDIEFAAPPPIDTFRSLAGVREAELTGNTMHIAFEGSADPLVKAAAAHEVVEIRSRENDLEDVFLSYFQEPAA
ncbi:MAG: beta-exotoxin transport system ATP-binding protein [Solirubrobacteraceae bacterium]|jgi:ABC-2 type transport system ATP-binding protein|nr:beta-exotoxin transport system ATP-binding protein [Solirubrobacteraceae bacterium]